MTSREDIHRKIQALLEKTLSNGATQEEAELAASKAAELATKYGLELRKAELKQSITHKNKKVSSNRSQRKWQTYLAGGVGKVCFCYVIRDEIREEVIFVGTKTEIELAEKLLEFLSIQIAFIAAEETAGQGKVVFNHFCLGCTIRVCKRLLETHKIELSQEERGVAIVRVSDRENMEYAQNMFSIRRKPKTYSDTEAFRSGYSAGERVQLRDSTKLANTERKQLQ